jgi:hypothetical protein
VSVGPFIGPSVGPSVSPYLSPSVSLYIGLSVSSCFKKVSMYKIGHNAYNEIHRIKCK